MENVNKENLPTSSKEVKDDSSADVPAEEIEEDRNLETSSSSSSESSSDTDSDESEYECETCKKTFSGYLPFKQHQKGKKHAKALLKKKKEKKLRKMDETEESEEENLLQELYAECKTCKKEFYGPEAYEKHLKSKKHKLKSLEASILEQVKEEGKINEDKLRELCKSKRAPENVLEEVKGKIKTLTLDDDTEDNEGEFECKECEKLFSGLIPYTQHLISKTHAKKMEKKKLFEKVFPEKKETIKDGTAEIAKHYDANTLCVEDDVLICKSCSTSFSGPENAIAHIKSKKHAKKLEKYIRKLERKKQKKESEENDLSSGKETKVQTELEGQDEELKEKIESTCGGSERLDTAAISPKNNPEKSSNEMKEGIVGYEKYKEYKKIMNSLKEDES